MCALQFTGLNQIIIEDGIFIAYIMGIKIYFVDPGNFTF